MAKQVKLTHGGARKNSGRDPINKMEKKYTVTIQIPLKYIDNIGKVSPAIMKELFIVAVNRKRERLTEEGIL